MEENARIIEQIKKEPLENKISLLQQLDTNLLTKNQITELYDYAKYLYDCGKGEIDYADNPIAYNHYWKDLTTWEEREEYGSKFLDVADAICDACRDREKIVLKEEYEEEYSEEGLRKKLREDFNHTVADIFYSLDNYELGDYFEIDQSSGEDLTTQNMMKAKVIKELSQNPDIIKILLEESEKQGIDISCIPAGKEFEYVGLMHAYEGHEVKFINDRLPSLAKHTGEMNTRTEGDGTVVHEEKIDYSEKNKRFVKELMSNPDVKLVYLSKTDDELIGSGYYDLLAAISMPDKYGISKVLDTIPVPVLNELGMDVNTIVNGKKFADKYIGIANCIGNNGDDLGSLNMSEDVIAKMNELDMWKNISSEFAGIGQYEEYITEIEKKINDFKDIDERMTEFYDENGKLIKTEEKLGRLEDFEKSNWKRTAYYGENGKKHLEIQEYPEDEYGSVEQKVIEYDETGENEVYNYYYHQQDKGGEKIYEESLKVDGKNIFDLYSNNRFTNGWFVTTVSEKYFNPNTGERISKDEFFDTVSAAEAPSIYDIYPEDLQALVNPDDCINYDKVEFAKSEDDEVLEKYCTDKDGKEVKISLNPNTHDISEIEDVISDRRPENVNDVTETIHKQVGNNEIGKDNSEINPEQETK